MKKIGTIENHYAIYWKSNGHYRVEFQYDGHTISLSGFEYYPRMSEETNAFVANLILDGVMVGECSNEGRGGCANYYAYNNWDLAKTVGGIVSQIENFCFPRVNLSLYDVIDQLADYYIIFGEMKSSAMAKRAVEELHQRAEQLRKRYSK